MNFSSWPDEFRPTKPEKSLKETWILSSLSLSLSLSLSRTFKKSDFMRYFPKNQIFTYLYINSVAHVVPCVPLVQVRIHPETIYFIPVQGQIILHKLSLNYFTTSNIFLKNFVFWDPMDTRHPEKRENSNYLGIQRN